MPGISKESRILIVDDSVIMRSMIRNILSDMGHINVDEAENGRVAYEKILEGKEKKNPFRIVFLDWAMPEMNGLMLLEKCRADPEMAPMAIVIVTAVTEQINMVEAISKGATAYVTKPFAPEKVSEALKFVSSWAEKLERS